MIRVAIVEDDAEVRESIAVLQEKGVKLPHATRVKPGQPVKLELEHRNVKEAALLIYRVDLKKLHERQKDLSSVSGVNLSGITPQAEIKVPLGDGLDYAWKKRSIELPLKDEGAYLVICRGDSQMTSGLVFALAGVALFAMGAAGVLLLAELMRRVLAFNIMGSGAFLVLVGLAQRNDVPDPVPQAMVLTGIVVAVAATALALALARRYQALGGRDELAGDD